MNVGIEVQEESLELGVALEWGWCIKNINHITHYQLYA